MRITINIETGSLGDQAGLARTKVEGNIVDLLIDDSRIADPLDIVAAIQHEIGHAVYDMLFTADGKKLISHIDNHVGRIRSCGQLGCTVCDPDEEG